jgi:hypothetical protein
MPLNLFLKKRIKTFFKARHNFGYFLGWDEINQTFVDFTHLSEKQQSRIVEKNLPIFKYPGRYTYKDFTEVQLIYLGKNLLD